MFKLTICIWCMVYDESLYGSTLSVEKYNVLEIFIPVTNLLLIVAHFVLKCYSNG